VFFWVFYVVFRDLIVFCGLIADRLSFEALNGFILSFVFCGVFSFLRGVHFYPG
jgi:hypothetical protein